MKQLHIEEQTTPVFDVAGLEETARSGIETYRGRRVIEFRGAMELEFQIGDMEAVRRNILENDDVPQNQKAAVLDRLIDRDIIDADLVDNSAIVAEFRQYARGFITRLTPKDAAEQQTKSTWLSQVDSFAVSDLINFLLYEEFSRPQLDVPRLASGVDLKMLDAFAESNGWIEWRFGNSSLQSGYYDNPGVSEIRLSPCEPSELVRRAAIVRQRIIELGRELGVPILSDANHIHINFSAFESGQALFGNSGDKAADTVDAVSGIAKAHQDGIGINPETARKYDYMFSRFHDDTFRVGPTRRLLRVLDGRVELRGGLYAVDQALAWLEAGTIYGLSSGKAAIEREGGYQTPDYIQLHKVERSSNFDKQRDLQIQRAFEHASVDGEGVFTLDDGYMMSRGREVEEAFFEGNKPSGLDVGTVISAVRIDADAKPYVTEDSLLAAHEKALARNKSDYYHTYLGSISPNELTGQVKALNERLATIRVKDAMAVYGETRRPSSDRASTLARLAGSDVIRLATGGRERVLADILERAAQELEARSKTS